MVKIIGLYKDISQFIVGILVDETDEQVTLRRALLVSVEKDKNGNGVVPNFFPITLLTLDPPFHLMGFLKEADIDFPTTFQKKSLLNPKVLELNDQVVQIYLKNFIDLNPPTLPPTPKNPENNIIKLFD